MIPGVGSSSLTMDFFEIYTHVSLKDIGRIHGPWIRFRDEVIEVRKTRRNRSVRMGNKRNRFRLFPILEA